VVEILNRNQTFASPSAALAHYGTKGMKWGVRKDNKSSAASSELAPLLTTVAIFAGIKIAQARYRYVDSGQKQQRAINKEEKKSGQKHEWKKKESLTGPKTEDQILKDVTPAINKGYPKQMGTSMNCRRCTFAYEMRRRGYDVKATKSLTATGQDDVGLTNAVRTNPKSSAAISGWGKNPIMTTVNGQQMTSEGKSRSIFDTLSREPDGSRGELAVSWPFGGGHSVAYEVIGGKPVIFDTQSNKSWSNPIGFNNELGGLVNQAAFTRLDNVNLNNDFLKRWIADA
jgi:hypothetical protein